MPHPPNVDLNWTAFTHKGLEYSLSHLHRRSIEYVQVGECGEKDLRYPVDVAYSTHCFTRRPPAYAYDRSLEYRDARELRLFDFARYELSKQLPEILATLTRRGACTPDATT